MLLVFDSVEPESALLVTMVRCDMRAHRVLKNNDVSCTINSKKFYSRVLSRTLKIFIKFIYKYKILYFYSFIYSLKTPGIRATKIYRINMVRAMIKRPKTPNKNLVEAELLVSSSTVRMLCPARMEVCIRPDGVGQQPQEWNIVMSQPNFDPNHNPYQQNPQPNQGQYQQPYPPGQPIYVTQQTNDVSTVAMWGHLSGLLGGFIIPLVIWAIYKDKPGYELARRAAARAFNFGLTGYLIVLITLLSGFVYIFTMVVPGMASTNDPSTAFSSAMGMFAPITLMVLISCVVQIMMIIFQIIAAVKSNSGEDYKYPLPTLPILR